MANLPTFRHSGDRALTVELGDAIDEVTNALVIALDRRLTDKNIPGVVEMVPTYRSLLIMFDPAIVTKEAVRQHVLDAWPPDAGHVQAYRRWTVPVLYGGAAGEDLEEVARLHELSTDEVISLHTGAEYRVYMIGFAPGFAYLGGLPERLHTSRRVNPRLRIPPGSIAIGGQQAAIFPPIEVPSGWQLLGRTPVKTYDSARAEPFLLDAGDRVVFTSISKREYAAMHAAAEAGDIVAGVEAVND